jgi:two-component system LytT family response regulator
MPDLSGFEVARHLRGPDAPIVVFVTAYDRYAVEAFEVAALDYVLKPLRRDRLAEAVRRVVEEHRAGHSGARSRALQQALEEPPLRDQRPELKRLPVRHKREVRLLDLTEVPLIFSRDRLVLARCEGHEYLVDYTLQELETRLPEGQFVRVHRGALVNVDAIESYGGEEGVLVLRLKDGTRVEASERRAAEVRRRLR